MEKIKIFAFAGSLRKNSYNKALLRNALELLPENIEMEIFDLEGIPLYNPDLDPQTIAPVMEFKAGIKAADAIMIATPEYNYSMPGVLKNAIDWASRPFGDNSFDNKPLAIIGASTSMIATARAQYHLRQSCVFLNMHPLNKPEVMLGTAHEKIDGNGVLNDDKTKELIKSMFANLVILIKHLSS